MNFIERVQSKIELKNYTFKKDNLILELEDSTYNLNLTNCKLSHVNGRYSELIHDNLIKLISLTSTPLMF
jgi:hypothetical protein